MFHSNASLANLYIVENEATYGAGIDFNTSSPTLTDSTITNNYATTGGGIYVTASSSPTLSRVNFYNNAASGDDTIVGSGDGGAIYHDQTAGSLTLTDVFIDGNTATHAGGGMYNLGAHAALTRVRINYNNADFGAGLIMENDTGSTLLNVGFTGNEAAVKGGGLYNYLSHPLLTNVLFSHNTAVFFGGGMGNYGSTPTLTNVTFSLNTAPQGGGIYNSQNSNPQVRNSILWNDSGGEIYHDPLFTPSTITIKSSLVQGCDPGGSWNTALCGSNNGDNTPAIDPRFENPTGYNFRLQVGSPAINRGNTALVSGVATDMDGHPRVQNGIVDLGPYETLSFRVYLPLLRR